MRANSLTNLGVSLDYNVASDYDKVLVLSGIASEIEELAPHANEIATLVANLPDVLTVQEASELVNNLTVKVTTLPEGSTATSELVGTEIRLGIPTGTQGVQGIQGPKGDKGGRGDTGLTGSKGPAGATGAQGPRGFRGEDGLDGEGVVITSILNNINKSLTINFSDGTQHTTDPLKGEDGRSVTITNVINNANGTMLIKFSDGTSHHTADLRGPIGLKGATGNHVHHIKGTSTTNHEGTFSVAGEIDTYTMYGDTAETIVLGEFNVSNGSDSYIYAVASGYVGTSTEFYSELATVRLYSEQAQLNANAAALSASQVVITAGQATTAASASSSSASSASASASTSTTKAAEALSSASTASTAASSASTSATTATTQAGISTTKANEASSSQVDALDSKNSASASATIATAKASEASSSATTALTNKNLSDVSLLLSKKEAWKAEAEKKTAESFASEPENVNAKTYISNDNGTFTATSTTKYSALHWSTQASNLILSGMIDDTIPKTDRVYSSSKTNGLLNLKVGIFNYATPNEGGIVKVRLNGTTAYITTNGNNA